MIERSTRNAAATPEPSALCAPRRASGESDRSVDAASLLGASGLLRIDLDGEVYTLRLTRNHRLILTK